LRLHACEDIPLWAHALALVVLILVSAFFSIAETSMMALNRFRLGHMVKEGRPGATRVARLLARTERLLGTVLLGNNLVNTAMTALVTSLAIRQFGNNDTVLLVATTVIALLIIVFCEITPKVIGASLPERIALPSSLVLEPLTRVMTPAVWFVNLLSGWMLDLLRVAPDSAGENRLSPEELRTIVLESGHFIPSKHRSILVNLFDLEKITVDDVMTPRNRVEALDVATSEREIREQLSTCVSQQVAGLRGRAQQGRRHPARAPGADAAAARVLRRCRSARTADRALLRAQRHAGVHPAAVLPGKPSAPGDGGR
jgi:Mg2+/Co2+ transporter CorB